jgi:hypothetical protein
VSSPYVGGLLAPRVIGEDATHQLRGGTEEIERDSTNLPVAGPPAAGKPRELRTSSGGCDRAPCREGRVARLTMERLRTQAKL